jgi:predicted RNA-binding Zn ribbon-like protein
VYVTSGHDTEIRLTLEAAVDVVNALTDGHGDVRAVLDAHGFTRAAEASAASIERFETRIQALIPDLESLPGAADEATVAWVNTELARIDVAPSLTTHDGAPLHIHWTPSTATFDDQVIADFLMALAQEICDHGTRRFGRCAATDCSHLFYDATRNGSRRFCSDPRCASRTHTADHRARQRRS